MCPVWWLLAGAGGSLSPPIRVSVMFVRARLSGMSRAGQEGREFPCWSLSPLQFLAGP